MRIGRNIIDTDNMTVEEISKLIDELRKIRARKQKATELLNRMGSLLSDATEAGFAFQDKDFGHIIQMKDLVLYDAN